MLAHRLCARLPSCVDVEELESDAYLGLIQAAKAFDPSHGTLFRTYAARRITGAMLDGLREREASRLVTRPRIHSLDAIVAAEDGREVTFADLLPDDAPPVGLELEMRDEAKFVLSHLPRESRQQLIDRYFHGMEQRQIAAKAGISASGVSQRFKQIRLQVQEVRCRIGR